MLHRRRNAVIFREATDKRKRLAEEISFFGHNARVVMINDITKRVQVEAELMEARDTAINALNIKSAFLAKMSHEIRTPLNAIIGMTELLQETTLRYLVNDILDLSKMEAEQVSIEEVDFSLENLIQDTVEMIEWTLAKKKLDLTIQLDPDVMGMYKGDVLIADTQKIIAFFYKPI